MGVGKGNVQVVNVSTSLPCFSGPGIRSAAARGLPILHAGLEGVFLRTEFPPTQNREGERESVPVL